MAMVMITCPVTRRQVFTGIETDAASIAMLPPVNARLSCPVCGNTHIWSVLDAELLCERSEQPAPAEPEPELRLGRLGERTRARDGQGPARRILPRAS